jgi:hypothetical protein
MNKVNGFLAMLLFCSIVLLSFVNIPKDNPPYCLSNLKTELISFKVKGNGKYYVELGVADKPGGIGSCCRGVASTTTVSFQGHIGDVLFDSRTKKVIIKINADTKGTTIDLKDYY